ncbi:MAG: peptidase M20 [Verrucomicrobiales bacterium]|nr:peptidase M20 [Verrucomicrobiales bacterium]
MQAVLEYLSANEDRFVDELCTYLRFPSVSAQSTHDDDLRACADWLVDHCRSMGLKARRHATSGHPVVTASTPRRKGRPHFLVYGHYDVQPPDPLDQWKTPPFEPNLRNGAVYARGATDNKGQHFAHLKAVEAYLKTGTELPCNLTFVVEGEEEVGSEALVEFLRKQRRALACDAVVISDTGMPSKKHPALTYALRGVAALEVRVRGPRADLHSGIYGGSVDNPALVLAQMLAKLRDARGRIAVPGFYDGVEKLSAHERRQFKRLPYNEKSYRRLLGVPALFGERGYTAIEQRSARPTLEINGLTSGYQGEGSKTIVPAEASAKITCRLVPGQSPSKIVRLLKAHLRKLCPPTVCLKLEEGHGADPYLVSPTGAQAQAALASLKEAFGHEPVILREGGSIPIVTEFKKILGADSLLLGLALPDDNLHSPNEKFDLDCLRGGTRMSAHLWPRLAEAC